MSLARGRRRAGARAPRYHPACAQSCAPLKCGRWRAHPFGSTGLDQLFFRRLPGDGRIGAVAHDS